MRFRSAFEAGDGPGPGGPVMWRTTQAKMQEHVERLSEAGVCALTVIPRASHRERGVAQARENACY